MPIETIFLFSLLSLLVVGDCSSRVRVLPHLSGSDGLLKQRARKKKLFSSELNSALRPGVVNFQRDQKKTPMSARWRTLARALGPVASSSTSGGLSASLSQARVRGFYVFHCAGEKRKTKDQNVFLKRPPSRRRARGGSLVGGRENPLCCIPAPSLSASPVPRLPSLLAHT